MRRVSGVVAFSMLAALSLLAPLATAAEQTSGTFTVADRISFPPDGNAQISPLALLDDETQDVAQFHAQMPSARVCVYEMHFIVTDTPLDEIKTQSSEIQEDCSLQNDLTLELVAGADHAGWFGVYPEPGSEMLFTPSAPYQWEPRKSSVIANADASTGSIFPGEDGPSIAHYVARITGGHVWTSSSGTIDSSGRSAFKLLGMDLMATTPGSSTVYRTGIFDEPGPAHDRLVRWLYVTFESGTFTLESPGPMQLAADSVDAQTRGEITFIATEGQLSSTQAIYEPRPGQLETLEGTFAASLAPTSNAALLTLNGQLASTSLQRTAIPATRLGDTGWVGIVALGAVLGGATLAGGVVLYRNRQRRDPGSPDDAVSYFTHYALIANDQFQFALALEWLRPAQEIAPEDAELSMWAATLLGHLGMHAEAMAAYAKAAETAAPDDGEPEYWAAVALLHKGAEGTMDAARFHLERALQRQPDLARAVFHDPLFAPLHGPDFEAMIDEAEKRLETQ